MTSTYTLVEHTCFLCGRKGGMLVDTEGLRRWQSDLPIQDAFPTMTPSEREFLIDGVCPPCQDLIFAEPEE